MLLQSATEAIKACQQRAINRSQALDPDLSRTVRIECGRYEVTGNHGVYTVSVNAHGYGCTCEGAKHPACWHRASVYRYRLAERARRGMTTTVEAPAAPTKPARAPYPWEIEAQACDYCNYPAPTHRDRCPNDPARNRAA